jgi:hypothetical protein
MRIGLSAGKIRLGVGVVGRGFVVTAVFVDQVHEVLGLPFGEGDQRHSEGEGRGVPWPWEGAEGMEELGVHDAVG